jgi:hypothetical protein
LLLLLLFSLLLLLLLLLLLALAGGCSLGCLGMCCCCGRAALFSRTVVVGFKAVLQAKRLLAQLTGDRYELLFAAALEGARVLL